MNFSLSRLRCLLLFRWTLRIFCSLILTYRWCMWSMAPCSSRLHWIEPCRSPALHRTCASILPSSSLLCLPCRQRGLRRHRLSQGTPGYRLKSCNKILRISLLLLILVRLNRSMDHRLALTPQLLRKKTRDRPSRQPIPPFKLLDFKYFLHHLLVSL